jgi:SHS2 domain-containing protein
MYRWVDHTAEVELEVEAPSEREVLEDAMRALAELLGVEAGRGDERRTVTVHAGDRPALLAAWIEELAFLAETEGFVAVHALKLDLQPAGIKAEVAGVLGEPPPLVKAVTYHRLAFEPSGEGYLARVILDV